MRKGKRIKEEKRARSRRKEADIERKSQSEDRPQKR
jgi:hypothetical protein